MIPDAHAHINTEEELQERIEQKIPSLICLSRREEMAKFLKKSGESMDDSQIFTCGVHPWYADQDSVKEVEPYLKSCRVIGEIGMDCIWCQVPLECQRQAFIAQLELARQWNKPVILHTKGMEEEVSTILADFPNRYLVHWYSSDQYLERYLALDCYVSIGPDVWWSEVVQQVAAQVPLDRLLVETDGMGAVEWAYEEAPVGKRFEMKNSFPQSIQEVLNNSLLEVARIRKLEPLFLANQIRRNYEVFVNG